MSEYIDREKEEEWQKIKERAREYGKLQRLRAL